MTSYVCIPNRRAQDNIYGVILTKVIDIFRFDLISVEAI